MTISCFHRSLRTGHANACAYEAMKCEHSFNYSRFLLFGGRALCRDACAIWRAPRIEYHFIVRFRTIRLMRTSSLHVRVAAASVCVSYKFQAQPFMNNGPFTNFHFGFRSALVFCVLTTPNSDRRIQISDFFPRVQPCAGRRFTQFTRELYEKKKKHFE